MEEQPTNVKTAPNFTYLDVMAVAFALTGSNGFRGSPDEWSVAWREALRDPDAQNLLPEVFFVDHEPYPPTCPEVENLVRSLSRSGILHMQNPSYQIYTTSDDSKEAIREGNLAIIDKYRPTLQRIAEALDEHIGISS